MRAMIALGLFAALAAGMAPAQVAEPERTVMVFFDWGKFTVERDYAAALDAEADTLLKAGQASVAIEGHSDRSGPAGANLRSSRRRAEVVRDYLIAKGVPADRIVVRAWGEARPLIATADGVREPQNRRVDVRILGQGQD